MEIRIVTTESATIVSILGETDFSDAGTVDAWVCGYGCRTLWIISPVNFFSGCQTNESKPIIKTSKRGRGHAFSPFQQGFICWRVSCALFQNPMDHFNTEVKPAAFEKELARVEWRTLLAL